MRAETGEVPWHFKGRSELPIVNLERIVWPCWAGRTRASGGWLLSRSPLVPAWLETADIVTFMRWKPSRIVLPPVCTMCTHTHAAAESVDVGQAKSLTHRLNGWRLMFLINSLSEFFLFSPLFYPQTSGRLDSFMCSLIVHLCLWVKVNIISCHSSGLELSCNVSQIPIYLFHMSIGCRARRDHLKRGAETL